MIEVRNSRYGYYISSQLDTFDWHIANVLKLTMAKYQSILISKFNGHRSYAGDVYFKNKEDADRAFEWIESMKVMNQLGGK